LFTVGLLLSVSVFGQAAHSQLSAAQKAEQHSKLYENYRTGKDLRQLASQGTQGVVEVHATTLPGYRVGRSDESSSGYPAPYLKEIAYRADAVVVCVVQDSVSHLTDDGGFVFTDHEVLVEEVLKDNPRSPAKENQTMTITRPGGAMTINGRLVKGVDDRFPVFPRGGRYLLFLKEVPTTGSYRALADWSFELVEAGPQRGARLVAPSPRLNIQSAGDAGRFLAEARLAVQEAAR
jgi:hypothetical protein